MRERPADTGLAVGLSIGVHALVFFLIFLGWRFSPQIDPLSVAGPPIEVDLVRALPMPVTTPAVVEPPLAPVLQPQPEPAPQDAMQRPQPAAQTPQPTPDPREQAAARRDVLSPQPPAPREQQERRREQQVDLTEREEQRRVEERQRLSPQQLERLARLDELRRQRLALDAQVQAEQQQPLAQPSPAAAPGPATVAAAPLAGNAGDDTGLQAAYALAIQNAVERHWIRPETIPPGTPCRIRVIQLPGGEVISVEVEANCPFDAIGQRSLEAAVLRAQPLPYAGFESVFRREVVFTFRAPPD